MWYHSALLYFKLKDNLVVAILVIAIVALMSNVVGSIQTEIVTEGNPVEKGHGLGHDHADSVTDGIEQFDLDHDEAKSQQTDAPALILHADASLTLG